MISRVRLVDGIALARAQILDLLDQVCEVEIVERPLREEASA